MTNGLEAPERRLLDVIINKIANAGTYGIDLDHIAVACGAAVDSNDLEVIERKGGWVSFTMAQVVAGRLRTFKEGPRTIVIVDGQGLEEKGSSSDSSDSELGGISDLTPLDTFSIRSEEFTARPPSPLSHGGSLSRHHREALIMATQLRNVRHTELLHHQDALRQDALRLLRAITLLLRFRDVFRQKTNEQIMQRLEEEGDVKHLGGTEKCTDNGGTLRLPESVDKWPNEWSCRH